MYINKQDDLDLINSPKQKDQNKLYKKYTSIINGIFFSKTRDKELSLDMTQDVLIKIHNNLHKFDQAKPFNRWVYQIAINHLIDYQRNLKCLKQKSETKQFSIDNPNIFNSLIYDNDDFDIDNSNNLIITIMNNLNETDKIIFDLYINKNQSIKDISETILISKIKVTDKINNIFKKIKSQNVELFSI